MSVTVSKTDGTTVFTLTTDPQSSCPPLCQIIQGLCYSPVCCSVSQRLRTLQRTSQSVLGALHFMVGLLNIGLGVILCCSRSGSGWQMDDTLFPYWFGGIFVLFGIISILSEKYPSPCLVIINVILNLSGVCFAISAIVLYSINTAQIWAWWMCRQDDYSYTQSPGEEIIMSQCLEGKELVLMLLRGISGLLIVLSVLELSVATSGAVLGIKALSSFWKKDKSTDDPEHYRPLLEEVTSNPTV